MSEDKIYVHLMEKIKSFKSEGNSVICKMSDPEGYDLKEKKSDREGKYYTIQIVWWISNI